MRHYFGYIRVSTAKQGERSSSLQEQRSSIETFAQRNNLNIIGWFEERETAAKQGRRMFTRLLAELQSGRAQGVIIHKIDRSARNLRDWANLGDLIDSGVDVQFAHDGVDLRSRGGRLSADIQAVVAADYIRNLRDEVKKGFYGRLKQGFYPLPAPIGYLDRGKARAKDVDPILGPLVRQAFELYAKGTTGLKNLRIELGHRGLNGKDREYLSVAGLSKILGNPFYIGLIRIRRTGETFQGVHQPLVSKALFDRVQAILEGKTVSKIIKHEFVYRRCIRCAACGYHLSGERQKRRYVYYRCHTENCIGVCVREEAIDTMVRASLAHLRFDDGEAREIRELIDGISKTSMDEIAQSVAALRMRLSKSEERLARLTDALIDCVIDKETYETRKATALGERRTLLDALEALQKGDTKADRARRYFELANNAYVGFESAFPSERREILQSITSNLSVSGKSPAITLQSPYREIVNSRILDDGGPRPGRLRTQAREITELLIASYETPDEYSGEEIIEAA